MLMRVCRRILQLEARPCRYASGESARLQRRLYLERVLPIVMNDRLNAETFHFRLASTQLSPAIAFSLNVAGNRAGASDVPGLWLLGLLHRTRNAAG
jgi:hypothetical protein